MQRSSGGSYLEIRVEKDKDAALKDETAEELDNLGLLRVIHGWERSGGPQDIFLPRLLWSLKKAALAQHHDSVKFFFEQQ